MKEQKGILRILQVLSFMKEENPRIEITVFASLKCSTTTISKIINTDVSFEMVKIHNVHRLYL